MENLSRKFWETPTNIKNGYLEKVKKEETKKESPKFMEIRNGEFIGWRPL